VVAPALIQMVYPDRVGIMSSNESGHSGYRKIMKPHRCRRSLTSVVVMMVSTMAVTLSVTLSMPAANAHFASPADTVAAGNVLSPEAELSNSPSANPPGSADGDRDDWSGLQWLPFLLLSPVVAVGVAFAQRE
jgi:hypothetical protein